MPCHRNKKAPANDVRRIRWTASRRKGVFPVGAAGGDGLASELVIEYWHKVDTTLREAGSGVRRVTTLSQTTEHDWPAVVSRHPRVFLQLPSPRHPRISPRHIQTGHGHVRRTMSRNVRVQSFPDQFDQFLGMIRLLQKRF